LCQRYWEVLLSDESEVRGEPHKLILVIDHVAVMQILTPGSGSHQLGSNGRPRTTFLGMIAVARESDTLDNCFPRRLCRRLLSYLDQPASGSLGRLRQSIRLTNHSFWGSDRTRTFDLLRVKQRLLPKYVRV
jgi:hypothetical protein